MVRGSAGENIAETLSVVARSAGFKTGIVANSVEPLNKGHIGTSGKEPLVETTAS